MLRVIWPETERHAAKVPILGSVSPSSAVTINGVPDDRSVPTDTSAPASALEPGANEIQIEAEDLAGRRINNTATLVRVAGATARADPGPRPPVEAMSERMKSPTSDDVSAPGADDSSASGSADDARSADAAARPTTPARPTRGSSQS